MRTEASSESRRVKALKKQMTFLAELFEEAVVETQCQEVYYEGQRRPEPAEECRERERHCRRRAEQLASMTEEVAT